jgi:SagB-type dehydrogenase family enzyme
MAKGIGKRYLLESQYKSLDPSEQSLGLPQPPLELDYDHSRHYIELPDPASIHVPPADLRRVIEQRRSVRAYSEQSLTLQELSWLLWATQGVEKVISRPATLRAVPSAGARHAFETYLLANKVEGITPGLHRYAAGEHKLVEIDTAPDMAERVAAAAWGQDFVTESAATFIWVAVLARMYWRYGERAYRYLFLDAGHVCQNLYLAAEAIGCGVCAIGAFYEDLLHPLLGIDGDQQFVVYLGAAGKKKSNQVS